MEQRVQEVFEELSSALQQSHLNVQKYNGTVSLNHRVFIFRWLIRHVFYFPQNLEHHAMSKEELTFMRTLTNELKSFNSMSEKFVREKKLTTSSNCKEVIIIVCVCSSSRHQVINMYSCLTATEKRSNRRHS